MELILFSGLQGAGKSTFYHQHFANTHLRLNLDMLKTRRREAMIFEACLTAGQRLVVDNTNPAPADRARYLGPALKAGFHAVSYVFDVEAEICRERNAKRTGKARIPEAGIRATTAKLRWPRLEEGFQRLYRVDAAGAAELLEEVSREV